MEITITAGDFRGAFSFASAKECPLATAARKSLENVHHVGATGIYSEHEMIGRVSPGYFSHHYCKDKEYLEDNPNAPDEHALRTFEYTPND